MTVYVDPLGDHGWKLRGHPTKNCHLFTDEIDLKNLHRIAQKIGMKKSWFQDHNIAPHYDLTPERREQAIKLGAKEATVKETLTIWRSRLKKVGKL